MSTIIHLSQCYPKTHFFQKTKHFCCWCRHAFATYICCLFKWIEYENLIDFLSYDSSGHWKSSVLVLILILVLLIWRNLCSGRCVYAHQVCSPIKMITNRNTQKISNTKIKNLCSRAYNALFPPSRPLSTCTVCFFTHRNPNFSDKFNVNGQQLQLNYHLASCICGCV